MNIGAPQGVNIFWFKLILHLKEYFYQLIETVHTLKNTSDASLGESLCDQT